MHFYKSTKLHPPTVKSNKPCGKDISAAAAKRQRQVGYKHNDLHAENIMVDQASGAFHDIIDWDHATKMTKKE